MTCGRSLEALLFKLVSGGILDLSFVTLLDIFGGRNSANFTLSLMKMIGHENVRSFVVDSYFDKRIERNVGAHRRNFVFIRSAVHKFVFKDVKFDLIYADCLMDHILNKVLIRLSNSNICTEKCLLVLRHNQHANFMSYVENKLSILFQIRSNNKKVGYFTVLQLKKLDEVIAVS